MAKKQIKKSYHHGHLRDALINAALKLIEKKGVKGLTLREIAKHAKVSHSAPYRHFKDKADLLTAVAVEGFETLVKETHKRFETVSGDPLSRFRESGLAYIDFAIAHPSHFRVMFGLGENRQQTPPALKKASGESFRILLDSIMACQEKTYIKAGDPMELALCAWSIVHGFATLYIEGYIKKYDYEGNQRLKEMITDNLYLGLHIKP
ncbi:MAG: TetR/AcrR family transcriptional regulator [Proteobacteria bacterium]|nr:TetR/AcrR family transcriptional regulator [Pseudomonadota bacterium]